MNEEERENSLEDNEWKMMQDQIDRINSILLELAYFSLDQKCDSSQSYNTEAIYKETISKLEYVLDMYEEDELPVAHVIQLITLSYYPRNSEYYPYHVGSYYSALDTVYARNLDELNDLIRVQLQMDPRYGLDENTNANNANNIQQQHDGIMEEEQNNSHTQSEYHATQLGIPPVDIIRSGPYRQTKTTTQQGCQIDYLIQTKTNSLFICAFKFKKT